MRKHKLTRKATVIFRFCHFKCADRNYIVRQYTYVFVCRKVANKGKKHIFFIKVGNILQIFSFISINANTFALNLNKITMNELNRIKVVLVEQKKTGKWLAEKLGVSVTTVSRWCSNSTQPDLQMLSKIATLLKVDTRDLLTPLNKDFQYPKQ